MIKLIGSLITLAVLAWAALFFSGKAVLVNQTSPTDTMGGIIQNVECTYFDGMALHKLDQAYSPLPALNELAGSSPACPRLVDTAGEI
jgi:hypothetical protein